MTTPRIDSARTVLRVRCYTFANMFARNRIQSLEDHLVPKCPEATFARLRARARVCVCASITHAAICNYTDRTRARVGSVLASKIAGTTLHRDHPRQLNRNRAGSMRRSLLRNRHGQRLAINNARTTYRVIEA